MADRRASFLARLTGQSKDYFYALVISTRREVRRCVLAMLALLVLGSMFHVLWLRYGIWALGFVPAIRLCLSLRGHNEALREELLTSKQTGSNEWRAIKFSNIGAFSVALGWLFAVPLPEVSLTVSAVMALLFALAFSGISGFIFAWMLRSNEMYNHSKTERSAA